MASRRRGGGAPNSRSKGTIQLRTMKAPGVSTIRGMFNQEHLDDKHMAYADAAHLDPIIGLLQHSHPSVRTFSESVLMQLSQCEQEDPDDGEETRILISSKGCQDLYKLLQLKDQNVQSGAMWGLSILCGNTEKNHENVIKDVGWLAIVFFARSEVGGGLETQIAAVTAISNLCLNEDCHEMVLKEGGLDLLKNLAKTTTDIRLKRPIANAFANLAADEDMVGHILSDGGLEVIIRFAQETDDELVCGAIHTIANLADVEAMRSTLVGAGAIPIAVKLLESRDYMIVKGAVNALSNLASSSNLSYQDQMIAAGCAKHLARLAKIAKNPDIQLRTAATINHLCQNPATREAMRSAGVVRPLRALARSRIPEVKEKAIAALTALGETIGGSRRRGGASRGAGEGGSSDDSDDDSDEEGSRRRRGAGGDKHGSSDGDAAAARRSKFGSSDGDAASSSRGSKFGSSDGDAASSSRGSKFGSSDGDAASSSRGSKFGSSDGDSAGGRGSKSGSSSGDSSSLHGSKSGSSAGSDASRSSTSSDSASAHFPPSSSTSTSLTGSRGFGSDQQSSSAHFSPSGLSRDPTAHFGPNSGDLSRDPTAHYPPNYIPPSRDPTMHFPPGSSGIQLGQSGGGAYSDSPERRTVSTSSVTRIVPSSSETSSRSAFDSSSTSDSSRSVPSSSSHSSGYSTSSTDSSRIGIQSPSPSGPSSHKTTSIDTSRVVVASSPVSTTFACREEAYGDRKLSFVEPIPRNAAFSKLSLVLESDNRVLKLSMEWIDEHDHLITRTRRVMWDLPFTAHPMYIDAFFKDHEFRADVFRPKDDGKFRRLVIPELFIHGDPRSGRQRVEIEPRASDIDYHCNIRPSVYDEKGRVYLNNGNEILFVFQHDEVSVQNGVKMTNEVITNRYVDLPDILPSGTIYFSHPLTVVAMKRLALLPNPQDIQIINLT